MRSPCHNDFLYPQSIVQEQQPEVFGVDLDKQTRCAHYHSALDIIAIRMACCGLYYACKDCHDQIASHSISVWPRSQWQTRAILCGACNHQLTIHEYMESNNLCPHCSAAFNPGCRNHYSFYFES